ncbi:hypothetical protein DCAR_0104248 [Daucus carota subsp. sativus]|uniref:Uncharacterized protein n=1 Tax=Daucus carota subsp. sativus TaxID=79200 RepID=A0A166INZ7_DAUCS|nr:PREDICTED: F-box protein At5g07610-like [Daucus carota subsp. sativus]WOG85061.1 hypothetical protein DCAR_0104248 [Daucus carota subsp. sativus]
MKPLCESVEKVISNDDLLTLILLRVPARSLLQLKCVSKHWLSLISARLFSILRNAIPLRASALFLQLPPSFYGVPCEINFVPLDDTTCIASSPFRNLTFANDPGNISRIRIVQSCGGLLLCSSCPFCTSISEFTLYVYNPTTNYLVTLPKHWPAYYTSIFAFDPSKSPHFKVFVCASPPELSTDQGRFQIYSSETGSWKASGHAFNFTSRADKLAWRNGVYFNGCIHWIGKLEYGCSYFNLDEERLHTMPRPPVGQIFDVGVSENHLHVIEVHSHDYTVQVFEMKNDYSGWIVKYKIDLSLVCQVFPEMTRSRHLFKILSLVRREICREDSFLVFKIPGKVIRYNLVDKSFKPIWDIPASDPLTRPRGDYKAYQYFESLSYV